MSVSRAVEVERKYEVPAGAAVPELGTLPGVTAAVAQPVVRLDAAYLDTADRTLLAARIACRRRTGGHDAGWHVKLRATGEGRTELHAPIDDRRTDVLPDPLEAVLRTRLRGRPLEPIARIRTERRAIVVSDDEGGRVEVVDDLVTATDVAADVVRVWREWEAEQVGEPEASAALLARIDAALRAAGATPSASPAKLAQALGLVGVEPAPGGPRTAGAVLEAAAAGRVEALHRGVQSLVLDGDPDGRRIHALRKALRRLRSVLAVTPVAGPSGAVLRERLGPIGRMLGEVRDPVVGADLAERLLAGIDPGTPGLPAARAVLLDRPRAETTAAVAAATERLTSPEVLDLFADLEQWRADGPAAQDEPAALGRLARRAVRRARRRTAPGGDLDALHRGRKAAKHARAVVDEVVAAGLAGRRSRLAAAGRAAKAAQDALGEHRDVALLHDRLPALSDALAGSGGNAFALGLLAASAARTRRTREHEAAAAVHRLHRAARKAERS